MRLSRMIALVVLLTAPSVAHADAAVDGLRGLVLAGDPATVKRAL